MAKGIAITIGVNKLDKRNFYSPSTNDLRGCVNDAKDIREIAKAQGFETRDPITDTDATRKAVKDLLEDTSGRLVSGDTLILHYSGHGTLKDLEGNRLDERGDTNSCWCLHDKPFSDNELYELWFGFKPGVRVLVISDSCHSGSSVRDIDDPADMLIRELNEEQAEEMSRNNPGFFKAMSEDAARVRGDLKGKEIGASVLLFAGCQDQETSGDLPSNGIFTGAIKSVWGSGFSGTIPEFFAQVRDQTSKKRSGQKPNWFPMGGAARMAVWAKHKPFTI